MAGLWSGFLHEVMPVLYKLRHRNQLTFVLTVPSLSFPWPFELEVGSHNFSCLLKSLQKNLTSLPDASFSK